MGAWQPFAAWLWVNGGRLSSHPPLPDLRQAFLENWDDFGDHMQYFGSVTGTFRNFPGVLWGIDWRTVTQKPGSKPCWNYDPRHRPWYGVVCVCCTKSVWSSNAVFVWLWKAGMWQQPVAQRTSSSSWTLRQAWPSMMACLLPSKLPLESLARCSPLVAPHTVSRHRIAARHSLMTRPCPPCRLVQHCYLWHWLQPASSVPRWHPCVWHAH